MLGERTNNMTNTQIDFEVLEHLETCSLENPCAMCKRNTNCKMCEENKAEKCAGTLCSACFTSCGKYHEDDCVNRKVCEKCNNTGMVEIMGGSDADEWGVIDTRPCVCQD